MHDDLMKFLDMAVRTTKEHAQNIRDIEEKAVYYRHAKDLENARRTLMKEYYAFEDYLASGKYEVPQIKFTTVSFPVKTV